MFFIQIIPPTPSHPYPICIVKNCIAIPCNALIKHWAYKKQHLIDVYFNLCPWAVGGSVVQVRPIKSCACVPILLQFYKNIFYSIIVVDIDKLFKQLEEDNSSREDIENLLMNEYVGNIFYTFQCSNVSSIVTKRYKLTWIHFMLK